MPNGPPRTLFKLGGSLLDVPDLAERLRRLAALRSEHRIAFLPGGGATADLVRDWSDRFALSDHAAHWLAIDAMGLNAQLLRELIPGSTLVTEMPALRLAEADERPVVLVAGPLLRQIAEAGGPSLSESWEVTSDAIAACLAAALGFDELVLVKSCEPAADTLETLAERGQVDPAFPEVAGTLGAVGWVNLRSQELRVRAVRGRGP
ncbi:uridylate kinase [Maioricimonas sp. JC845]|uniref:amino acid kinase family protein n=1 Tax=Maioricimonas sp. JC845 TaxID=3232138 RepID=UPI00345A93F2